MQISGNRSHGQIDFMRDAALDQLAETGWGPPEPEISEKECCDPLVMSATDAGREKGGRLVIPSPCTLRPSLSGAC